MNAYECIWDVHYISLHSPGVCALFVLLSWPMPLRRKEWQKISPSRLLGQVPGLKFIQVHPNALGGLNLIQLYPKAFETHSNGFFEGEMGWELDCWLVMYIYVYLCYVDACGSFEAILAGKRKNGKGLWLSIWAFLERIDLRLVLHQAFGEGLGGCSESIFANCSELGLDHYAQSLSVQIVVSWVWIIMLQSLSLQIVVSWVWIIISVEFCRTCSLQSGSSGSWHVSKRHNLFGTLCHGAWDHSIGPSSLCGWCRAILEGRHLLQHWRDAATWQ